MPTWDGSSIKYSLNGDALSINTKDGPIALGPVGSTQKNHYYNVVLGERGGSLNLTMPVSDYRGNRYIFTIESPNGRNIRLNFSNQSAAVKTIVQTYDRATNRTIISIKIGILNYGEVQYSIPGNPFGLPSGGRTRTLAVGESWSLVGIVCFLPGTLIRTPDGERLVETLRIGDEVCVLDLQDGKESTRSIVWIGRGHAASFAAAPDDLAGWPVCVRQNALGEGLPTRDLLVTGEHCLYVDGVFVPVRMLVNGRSILYDRAIAQYDYYHLETADQNVIWANGVTTETYLDTGNRCDFIQPGPVVSFNQPARSWEGHSCAPLATAREQVEPIYRVIEQRALAMGLPLDKAETVLSDDPDLHLETSCGQIIRPLRKAGHAVIFMIPAGAGSVRILSRVSRPVDTIGAFMDDRRSLGVLVGAITLYDTTTTRLLDRHLADGSIEGWEEEATPTSRWTTGGAWLELGRDTPDGIGVLAIEVLAGGPYPVQARRLEPVALYA